MIHRHDDRIVEAIMLDLNINGRFDSFRSMPKPPISVSVA